MKKVITLSLVLLFSISIFAQNAELSKKLIAEYRAGYQKAGLKSTDKHDHFWMTPLLVKVTRNWNDLTDEAKEVFKFTTSRPVFVGTELTATADNFVFHYTTNGPATESVDPTDADKNDVPDYVDNMYAKFAEVYKLFHTASGLTVPPTDGTEGGNDKYDIYMSNDVAGEGIYGYVSPESNIIDNPNSANLTEVDAYTSYMVMRSNYTGFGDENIALSVTAAHEYMHATQMGYAQSIDAWFMEASAAWSEEFAFPGYDDNFQYLMGVFGASDVALNLANDEVAALDGHWYSAWIFVEYITEQTGTEIIKSIYERCITKYALDAIDTELQTNWNTDFPTLLGNYYVANLIMTNNADFSPYTYNRATAYETHITNNGGFVFENAGNKINFSGTAINWNSATDGNDRLMRLSTDFFDFSSDRNFAITFMPQEKTVQVAMVLLKIGATSIEVQEADENGVINVTDQAAWDYFVPVVIRFDKDITNTLPFSYSLNFTAQAPALSVSDASVSIAAIENSTKTFNIVSNSDWTATCDQTWLTMNKEVGTGNATITLTAKANLETVTRTATVTITAAGTKSQIITVTQDAAASIFSVAPTTVAVGAVANSTNTFVVTSNVSWTVSDNEAWLTLSTAGATGNATITVTAAENLSILERTATVSVLSNGLTTQTVTVTQSGAAKTLTVTPTTVTIASLANSTNTLTITSNADWTITSDQTWLTLSSAGASGSATVTLTSQLNAATTNRTATVTVSVTGLTAKTINVIQGGSAAVLTVTPNPLTIGADAGSTKTFAIASNTDWTITSNQTWLTLSSAGSNGNATITLTALKNPTTVARIATVSVTGTGLAAQNITVTQDPNTTGFADIEDLSISIYPSPANEFLVIATDLNSDYKVLVSNIGGNNVITQKITKQNFNIDIRNLENGVYFVQILEENKIVRTEKIVVLH